ncbi:MAG: hypothetical protein RSE07_05300, partial [Oscillospiraceae bacterium]
MKKKAKIKMILSVNIFFIVILVIFSIALFWCSSQKSMFGKTALLYEYIGEDGNILHTFYTVKNKKTDVNITDKIAFKSELTNKIYIEEIKKISNTVVVVFPSNTMVDLKDKLYIGKVVNESLELGESLYKFKNSKGPLTAYIILVGIYFLSISLIFLLYALNIKKASKRSSYSPIKEIDDLDEIVYINERSSLDSLHEYYSEQKEITNEIPTEMLNTMEILKQQGEYSSIEIYEDVQ